jgi:hypothetical protein
MIKETIIAGTGILFKKEALRSVSFDFRELASEIDRLGLDVQKTGLDPTSLQAPTVQPIGSASTPEMLSPIFSPTSQALTHSSFPFVPFAMPNSIIATPAQGQCHVADAVQHTMGIRDTISKVYDQLSEVKPWWILEIIPTLTAYQEPTGDWKRKRM